MSIAEAFHHFVTAHIVTGSVGLLTFWIPVLGRKGGKWHRRGGYIFAYALLATGAIAILIAMCTILAPGPTHPHLLAHPDFGSAAMIRGIFGWMMLYLAVLTVNLSWYGLQCLRHKRRHEGNKSWLNLALQGVLTLASANCLIHGVLLGQGLMVGISFVGFATVGTNLWFIYTPKPGPKGWLLEHIKALVGAGISVYTAFLAFGAVRILPEAALTPALWSMPLIVGLTLIIYHQNQVRRGFRPKRAAINPSAE